jgi:hypothetical protein
MLYNFLLYLFQKHIPLVNFAELENVLFYEILSCNFCNVVISLLDYFV